MKIIRLLLTTFVLTFSIATTALAGEWEQDSKGWWYKNDDGTYPVSSWIEEGSSWYYVDAEGIMQTEDLVVGPITYHFNEFGACTNPYGKTLYNDDGSIDYSNWLAIPSYLVGSFAQSASIGDIAYIDGHYYSSPELYNSLFGPKSNMDHEAAKKLKERYDLADMVIK